MDPSDSDILYRTKFLSVPNGAPYAFQRSLDKGDNWSTRMMVWNSMTDMSICNSNPDAYYFTTWSTWATQSRIYKSSDGGINHSEVSYTGMTDIILEAPITSIVVNPFDENMVWVTYGGSGHRAIRCTIQLMEGQPGVIRRGPDYQTSPYNVLSMTFLIMIFM